MQKIPFALPFCVPCWNTSRICYVVSKGGESNEKLSKDTGKDCKNHSRKGLAARCQQHNMQFYLLAKGSPKFITCSANMLHWWLGWQLCLQLLMLTALACSCPISPMCPKNWSKVYWIPEGKKNRHVFIGKSNIPLMQLNTAIFGRTVWRFRFGRCDSFGLSGAVFSDNGVTAGLIW